MTKTYKTEPVVCSTEIRFDLVDGVLHNLKFTGGCNGNLKAIGKLCEGRDAKEVADLLEGNLCGSRPSSCADQLSKAIREALAEQN